MTTFRFARSLIVATCLAVVASGCCLTSIKTRASQQPCPSQTPYESGLLPIPQGAPPTFESPPSPLPPSPTSASPTRDFGVKTTAFFRSAGGKMKHALDKM